MGSDKVLGKIRVQLEELTKSFEEFNNTDVQPGASDCEKLQTQLYKIQDNLAVFKYLRLNQELSPSFNIHARISEEVKSEVKPDVPEVKILQETKISSEGSAPPQITKSISQKILTPIVIGVNDKFRFINELFSQNPAEFNIAIEQLSALQSWNESELYLNSLKSLYSWKEQRDVVKHLYSLVKRRFE